MRKKIIGILICMLLTTTSILPVVGTMNNIEVDEKNQCSTDGLDVEWQQYYGKYNDDVLRGVKQTNDGGYIAVGVSNGESHWFLKVDADGNEEWSSTALPNPNLWPRCYTVEQTSDGGYITAGCHESGAWGYDRCIWKVDQNGETEFCKIYDDPEMGYHLCIQETSDGGFIVSGEIDLNDSFNDWDVLLMKTDSTGEVEWQKIFRYGEFGDNAYAVRQTPDGGYILSGRKGNSATEADFLVIKTDSEGNIEWNKTYGGDKWEQSQSKDILFTGDGGYIFLAATKSFGAGKLDLWLMKTDSNGNMLWNKTFGGVNNDFSGGIDFTDDGGIIIAGTLSANSNSPPRGEGLVIKTDANGITEWQTEFGDESEDQLQDVCSTSDGGYIFAGVRTTTEGDNDGWLIKLKAFDNNQPSKPTISGRHKGKPGTEYTFTASSSDPDGQQIFYMWDWGDGNYSEWLDTPKATYSWATEYNFEIRVLVKDFYSYESEWSDPFAFSTPKDKAIITPFLLQRFFHRFPLFEKILNQIIQ